MIVKNGSPVGEVCSNERFADGFNSLSYESMINPMNKIHILLNTILVSSLLSVYAQAEDQAKNLHLTALKRELSRSGHQAERAVSAVRRASARDMTPDQEAQLKSAYEAARQFASVVNGEIGKVAKDRWHLIDVSRGNRGTSLIDALSHSYDGIEHEKLEKMVDVVAAKASAIKGPADSRQAIAPIWLPLVIDIARSMGDMWINRQVGKANDQWLPYAKISGQNPESGSPMLQSKKLFGPR